MFVGPVVAVLYQVGEVSPFGGTLGDVWVIVLTGAAGVAVGFYGVRRGAPILGALSVIANGVVTALYGFLALFFSLGGSR